MTAASTERKLKRARNKSVYSAVKYTAELFALLTVLFFTLNDMFFHIGKIPSSYDVIRFFGGGAKPYAELSEGEASVSFIDVGQGDCTLIRTNGYNILIDCGEDNAAGSVIGFLKQNGVSRLDLVIATHQHSDHCGGMYKILQSFNAGLLLIPEIPAELFPSDDFYEKLLIAASDDNVSVRYAKAGETFILGEDSYLEIIAPVYYDYDDVNDFSVAARFVHGDNSFLFTGDMTQTAESDLIENCENLRSDVLKAGHHGSAGSSGAEFLEKVSPKITVFEAAEINYYEHPSSAVLKRLKTAGCGYVYSTADNGNIVIVSDGSDLRVKTERSETLEL